MKHSTQLTEPRAATSTCSAVAAFGVLQAAPDVIAALRRNPVPAPGSPLTPLFLKHADDQTVIGLAAVYQAIYNHGLAHTDLSKWGVIAAPCFLGRKATAQALKRFELEGAWGVSPHLIPHHSVHALSGTISQALGIHGPNFGVGGGPGGVIEALLLAATLLSDASLPGLWLVLTEFDPELIPSDPDQPSTNGHHAPSLGIALALALVTERLSSSGISLSVCASGPRGNDETGDRMHWPVLNTVRPLADAFSQNSLPSGRWRLGTTGWMELTSMRGGGKTR